jgi:hypothetical protein
VNDEQVGARSRLRDRCINFEEIERYFGDEGCIGDLAARNNHQRIAVGGRFRGHSQSDRAPGAAPVVHHERTSPGFAELVCDEARDDVAAAAGLKAGDEPHRFGGVLLCIAVDLREERQRHHCQ